MKVIEINDIEGLQTFLETMNNQDEVVPETPAKEEVAVPKIESIITDFLDTVESGKLPTLEEAETINILNDVLRGR